MSKHTLRGIDFRTVTRIEGDAGRCRVLVRTDDGETHELDSYPGEGLYQKVSFWFANSRSAVTG